jgi:hypothetical protein
MYQVFFLSRLDLKEGLMTKNGPIDLAHSLAICMKKSN